MDELDTLRQRIDVLENLMGIHSENDRSLLNAHRDGAILLIGTIEDVLGIARERSALAKRRDEAILRKVRTTP